MPAIFLVATVVMTIVALSFLLKPLAGAERRALSVVLAIALPAFATGVYLSLGSPGVASAYPNATTAVVADNRPMAGSISSLVEGLAARLEENPEDSKGWLLLAKSYEQLNRPDDARYAYARAAALGETLKDAEKP
jgi:cytochrome c-type biogenesis protein CcmH